MPRPALLAAVLLLARAAGAAEDAPAGVPVIPPRPAAPPSGLLGDFGFFDAFGRANAHARPEAVCGVPEEFWTAFKGHLTDMARLGEALKERHAEAWAAQRGALAARVGELEQQAAVQLPSLMTARAQCDYAADGFARSETGRAALARSGSPFAGRRPDGTSLGRTFDGSRTAGEAGDPTPGAEGPGGTGLSPAAEGAAQGGLRTGSVPLESFEALTEGIVFSGARGAPAESVLHAALRHLFAVPAGVEVLRDVQRMRTRMGEEFARDKPRAEAELAEASAELARLEAAGTASPARLEALREKVRLHRDVLVPARSGDARPLVPVSFEATPNASGFSQQDFQVWTFEGRQGPVHVSRLVLDPAVLADGNPERAVDKLLAHELRHTADAGRLGSATERGLQWLLVEDRAFLQESRACLEQRLAMSAEPHSAFVTAMVEGDTAPMLRDPVAAREHLFAQPNYLWHVTPSDFADPAAALRARLAGAYRMLEKTPKGGLAAMVRTLERPGPGIGEAFRRARAESKAGAPAFDEQARFIALAADSWAGRNWLERVGALGEDFTADTPAGRALRAEYQAMERDYFEGLGRLSAGGAGR